MPPFLSSLPTCGGKRDDHVRHDIRNDHVIVAAEFLLQALVAEHVARADGVVLASHAVERGIFVGDAHALIVNVAGEGVLRAEQQRRNGQDAAAAAEVEHLFPAVDMLFQRLQAKARRRVAAGAEGETGV